MEGSRLAKLMDEAFGEAVLEQSAHGGDGPSDLLTELAMIRAAEGTCVHALTAAVARYKAAAVSRAAEA